jgi:hypothetical protein
VNTLNQNAKTGVSGRSTEPGPPDRRHG